jgi:hypothetical protein
VWEHYKLQHLSNLNLLVCYVHNLSDMHTIHLCSCIKNYPDKPSYPSVIVSKSRSFCGCVAINIIFYSEGIKLLWKNLPDMNSLFNHLSHVQWISYHDDMAHSDAVKGGDDLQVWRVAVCILNDQSWIVDKVWIYNICFCLGASNSSP